MMSLYSSPNGLCFGLPFPASIYLDESGNIVIRAHISDVRIDYDDEMYSVILSAIPKRNVEKEENG